MKADYVVANKAKLATASTNQSYFDADDINRKSGTVTFFSKHPPGFYSWSRFLLNFSAIQQSKKKSGALEAIRKVERNDPKGLETKRMPEKQELLKLQTLTNSYQKVQTKMPTFVKYSKPCPL